MTQLHKYETAHTPDHPLWGYTFNSKNSKRSRAKPRILRHRWVLGHSDTQPTHPFNALTSLKVFVLSRAHPSTDTHHKWQVPQPHSPGLLRLYILRRHVFGSPTNFSKCTIDQVSLNKYCKIKNKHTHMHTQMSVFNIQIKCVWKLIQTYRPQNQPVKNKAVLPSSNIHKENSNP